MMQGKEKGESEQDWNCTWGVGELKQVSDPHIEGNCLDREAFEPVEECNS